MTKTFGKWKIEPLRIEGWGALLDVNDREKQLLRPVRHFWSDCYGLQAHESTQGYVFDGASKWAAGLWRLMGHPWGGSAKSGLIHDRTFTERFFLSNGERVTFEYAADLYLAFLWFTGIGWAQRNIEHIAVLSPVAKQKWDSHNAKFAAIDAARLEIAA